MTTTTHPAPERLACSSVRSDQDPAGDWTVALHLNASPTYRLTADQARGLAVSLIRYADDADRLANARCRNCGVRIIRADLGVAGGTWIVPGLAGGEASALCRQAGTVDDYRPHVPAGEFVADPDQAGAALARAQVAHAGVKTLLTGNVAVELRRAAELLEARLFELGIR